MPNWPYLVLQAIGWMYKKKAPGLIPGANIMSWWRRGRVGYPAAELRILPGFHPSQLENDRIIRVGAGHAGFIRAAFPWEGPAELQRLGEGKQRIEGPGTHSRWRRLAHNELVPDLMAGLAGPFLRYHFSDYFRHATYALELVSFSIPFPESPGTGCLLSLLSCYP